MRQQRGFTLLEVMVSIGIFGIISGMMATSFVTMIRNNYENEVRTGAYQAAQQVLDTLRQADPSSIPTSGNSGPQNITIGNRTYSATTYYCEVASQCASASIRGLRVAVTFRSKQRYSVGTVFSQLQ